MDIFGELNQIKDENRRHILAADTAPDFAAAMVEAYRDESLWRTLSDNGRQSLQGRFTPQVAQAALNDALRSAVSGWSG